MRVIFPLTKQLPTIYVLFFLNKQLSYSVRVNLVVVVVLTRQSSYNVRVIVPF